MSTEINYDYHVFISYAKRDNKEDTNNNRRVDLFLKELDGNFSDQGGAGIPLKTWRDEDELACADVLGRVIEDGLQKTAVFIPILSATYLAQKWCRKEFISFCKFHESNTSLIVNNKLRIAPVILSNAEPDKGLEGLFPDLLRRESSPEVIEEIEYIINFLNNPSYEPIRLSLHDERGITFEPGSAELKNATIELGRQIKSILDAIYFSNAQEKIINRDAIYVTLPEINDKEGWELRNDFIEELSDYFKNKNIDNEIIPDIKDQSLVREEDYTDQSILDRLKRSIGYVHINFEHEDKLVAKQLRKAIKVGEELTAIVYSYLGKDEPSGLSFLQLSDQINFFTARLNFRRILELCELVKVELVDAIKGQLETIGTELEKNKIQKKRIFFWHGYTRDDEDEYRRTIEEQLLDDENFEILGNLTKAEIEESQKGLRAYDLIDHEIKSIKLSDGVLIFQGSANENWCLVRMTEIMDKDSLEKGIVVNPSESTRRLIGYRERFQYIPNIRKLKETKREDLASLKYDESNVEELKNELEVFKSRVISNIR